MAKKKEPRRRSSKSRSSCTAPVSEENSIEAAKLHHQAGNLLRAEEMYRSILNQDSKNAEALHYLGIIAFQKEELDEAFSLIARAIRHKPATPEFHTNMGLVLQAQGKLDAAAFSIKKSLELNPNNSTAMINLGGILAKLEKHDEAVKILHDAICIQPDSVEAQYNLATAFLNQGKPNAALERYQNALDIMPEYADAHAGRGKALADLGRLVEAESTYLEALRLQPNNQSALLKIASMYLQQEKLEQALEYFEKLLKIQPESLDAILGKMTAFTHLNMANEAETCIKHALRIAPDDKMLRLRADTYCPIIIGSSKEIVRRRQNMEAALENQDPGSFPLKKNEILRWGEHPSFYLSYHGKNDLAIRAKYADLFRIDDFIDPEGSGKDVFRVGFIVTERHEGIFFRFMEGILKNISNDRLEMFVVCTTVSRQIISEDMGDSNILFHVISSRLELAIKEIRAKRFDLLFYFEVGTDKLNYFLPFFRLAPIQCTSWGNPVTSGISQVDYFLSSHLIEPASAKDHYRECLECLDTLPVYYFRPKVPAHPGSRENFGIPKDTHIYLCAQSLFKIHPDYDKSLGEILREDPMGKVIMIDGMHLNWRRCLQARFKESIPDVAERIQFVPRMSREDYLRLITLSDVLLDPFPFGSGNSAYESIAMGTPIVTLTGEFMRGRVTTGCYSKIEVMDAVASSTDEYLDIALKLGKEKEFRKMVQEKILQKNSALFEDVDAVRELENFFIRAVEAFRS